MNHLTLFRFSAAVFFAVLCWSSSGIAQDRVLVFAAASTREAVEAVLELGRRDRGIDATASFASSAVLARQIASGAPAHVYISANVTWMDWVEGAGLIDPKTRQDLVGNGLALIAPLGRAPLQAPATLSSDSPILAWLSDGRLALGEPNSVPAGIYARQSLETLGLWGAVKDHLAPSGDVRAALALVERDAVPLGVVYRTDAAASDGVELVADIPTSSHDPIVYPMALTLEGATNPKATELMQLFLSPEGQEAFTSRGFVAVD
jgi:molybdate transport system substrate-binding protein